MDYFVYLLFRAFTAVVLSLPLIVVYRLGQACGFMAWLIAGSYRRLVRANMTVAYGSTRSPDEIRRLARRHFQTLGANLLSSIKTVRFDAAGIARVCPVEGIEHAIAALDQGKGIVMVLSHMGNWELYAPLCQVLPQYKWSCIYQPLGNRYIEAYVQRARSRATKMFSRKNGFNGPTAFLREGGAVGVLIDQHAGDRGIWTPMFGRLASTSTLAGILARRTDALLVPMAVQTVGPARWKLVITPPVPSVETDGTPMEPRRSRPGSTRYSNRQIDAAPADWFWVHNRWKTPKPKFLLATYRRGIMLPPDVPAVRAETLPHPRALDELAGRRRDDDPRRAGHRARAARRAGDGPRARQARRPVARRARRGGGAADRAGHGRVRGGGGRSGARDRSTWPCCCPTRCARRWKRGSPACRAGSGYAGHRRRWLLNQIISRTAPTPKVPGPRPPAPDRGVTRTARAEAIGVEEVARYGDPPVPRPTTPPCSRTRRLAAAGDLSRRGVRPDETLAPRAVRRSGAMVAAERACEWVIFGVEKDAPLAAQIEKALGERLRKSHRQDDAGRADDGVARLRRAADERHRHDASGGIPRRAGGGGVRFDGPGADRPAGPAGPGADLAPSGGVQPVFPAECPLDLRCLKAVTGGAEVRRRSVLSLDAPAALHAHSIPASCRDVRRSGCWRCSTPVARVHRPHAPRRAAQQDAAPERDARPQKNVLIARADRPRALGPARSSTTTSSRARAATGQEARADSHEDAAMTRSCSGTDPRRIAPKRGSLDELQRAHSTPAAKRGHRSRGRSPTLVPVVHRVGIEEYDASV